MKNSINRFSRSAPLTGAVAVVAVMLLVWAGCSVDQVQGPDDLQVDEAVALSPDDPVVAAAMAVQDRHTEELMLKPGVVGTGTGLTADGRPAVVVLLETEVSAKEAVFPEVLEEIPVRTLVIGKVEALKGRPGGGGVDHTARFDRPVPLGISTGHPAITAGTIGALVTNGSNYWALSNNHVYADENAASVGDAVIQPGTFDGGTSPADDVGTLHSFVPIVFSTSANNVVDAAIAATTTNDVSNTTTSDCYGTPKTETIAAAVNMSVQKCGRTTEHTTGSVSAINATVNVGYSTGTARFVNQIVITPGSFSAGGDSGSLVVARGKGRDKADDRKPVGLLFAGSAFSTIANPIDDVLAAFNVTIDGEAP